MHERHTAAEARAIVYERQMATCYACGYGMREQDMDAHHRQRRRGMTPEQKWCPCGIVGLHHGCHVLQPDSVHQRPEWARSRGLIVPSWTDDPSTVPVVNPAGWPAEVWLRCDGSWSAIGPDDA